jgi:hypothetical protein
MRFPFRLGVWMHSVSGIRGDESAICEQNFPEHVHR